MESEEQMTEYDSKQVAILQQIEPDYLLVTAEFILAKKNGVYILIMPTVSGIYFIKFKEFSETNKKSIHLPNITLTWGSGGKVDNPYTYRGEGTCVIPINRQQYVKGEALIYFMQNKLGKPESSSKDRKKSPPIGYSVSTVIKIVRKIQEAEFLYA
jgi:hypothetical protein